MTLLLFMACWLVVTEATFQIIKVPPGATVEIEPPEVEGPPPTSSPTGGASRMMGRASPMLGGGRESIMAGAIPMMSIPQAVTGMMGQPMEMMPDRAMGMMGPMPVSMMEPIMEPIPRPMPPMTVMGILTAMMGAIPPPMMPDGQPIPPPEEPCPCAVRCCSMPMEPQRQLPILHLPNVNHVGCCGCINCPPSLLPAVAQMLMLIQTNQM